MNEPIAQTVTGRVVQANDRGLKLDDGRWYNVSKFASPLPYLPSETGTLIHLQLDKGGYIRATTVPHQPANAPQTPPEAPQGVPRISALPDSRGGHITRQACLNTAVNILNGCNGWPELVGMDDVIVSVVQLAEALEVWVLR